MSLNGLNLPDRCSNYYELLGLALFEADATTIELKIRALLRDARKYQVGQYAAQAERCLDLLATARTCLLDADQKQAYDEELRRKFGLPPTSVPSIAVPLIIASPDQPAAGLNGEPRSGSFRMFATTAIGAAAILALWFSGVFSETSPHVALNDTKPAPESVAVQFTTPPESPQSEANRPPEQQPLKAAAEGTAVAQPAQALPRPASEIAPAVRQPPTSPAANGAPGAQAVLPVPMSPPVAGREGAANRQMASVAAASPAGTADLVQSTAPSAGSDRRIAPGKMGKDTESADNDVPAKPRDKPVSKPTSEPPSILELSQGSAENLGLSKSDVLRDLKTIRVNSKRFSVSTRNDAWRQAKKLVRYGYAAFADDPQFQKSLEHETAALKRIFPQLRDSLKDLSRTK